ncbi:MAG: hypothetical protein JWM20_840 [Patescibacteria group bacterium]|nr:hypothetical protein [Patescibacteria group bacterium]
MAVRITCINKDNGNHLNPHAGITHFGWVNEQTRATGKSTKAVMVDFLTKQGGKAYVKDARGNIAYVGVITNHIPPYLRTYADGKWSDNLLSLGEC